MNKKINYFFPVFKSDNIKNYLQGFLKTEFFKKNQDGSSFIFVCSQSDKKNMDYLLSEALKHPEYKIILLDKDFTYNDAFYQSLNDFDADVVLLGDTKIKKIDLVFNKCLEKKEKNIDVVHVVKKYKKVKQFFVNLKNKIYNFFIKIFTGKTDRNNITSLGLISRDVVDVLKEVPNKSCFLKNTKNLLGYTSRTIYIDESIETYKLNFKTKTYSLISSIISFSVATACLLLTILLNVFIKNGLSVYNIFGILVIILTLVVGFIFYPKHIFDIRNRENRKASFEIKKIN